MSEDIRIGVCNKCFKSIYGSDKELYTVPVKIKGKFSHNVFYHVECYKKLEKLE